MKKQQLEWVNIAKGMAICAVVLWHIDFLTPTSDYLPIRSVFGATWHVPVFFLISGFFIHEEQLKNPKVFIGKKMSKLYLQLLYYYIPCTLLHNVFIDWGWYDTAIDYHGKTMSYWGIFEMVKKIAMAVCFAGTEPILGAMWFLYVLLLAFIGYSLVSFFLSKMVEEKHYELCRAITLFLLCVISCTATQVFEKTIPRGNNTLTAIWLIYCGYIIRNVLKVKFNKWTIAILAFIILYHLSMINGCIHLNDNHYNDVITMTLSSIAALYVVCHISQRIEKSKMGKFLSICGRDSFHIMALHLIGFKVGITLMNLLGMGVNIATQKPDLGTKYPLVAALFLFSILFSLGFIYLFRKLKMSVIDFYTQLRKR